MKIQSNSPVAVISNVETQGEFRIKNSAKAFSILSSGLYSNKIKAVVRELSCNALDSHVEAGKANIPFTVHLPNQLEPYFSVTDYGIGLDHIGVTQLYTTYFESTKQDSNEFIGALGLGSKSPFSYTDNFTVTSIKDGMQRIYTAYIGDNGCPSIAMMGESETKEGNGLEVKFAVTERYDFNKFQGEAEEIFKWFKVKPIVTGNSYYSHVELKYKEENLIENVHLLNESGYGCKPVAVQGNIAYPIDLPADVDMEKYDELLKASLVLHFNIGELDIAASREGLSYIPLTVSNIKKRLDEVIESLGKYVAKELRPYKNRWLRSFRIKELWQTALFRPSIRDYMSKDKNTILKLGNWGDHALNNVVINTGNLLTKGISVRAYRVDHGWAGAVVRDYGTDKAKTKDGKVKIVHELPFSKKIAFLINDEKRGANARLKYHFKHSDEKSIEYVYLIDMKEGLDVDVEMKKILRSIHNPDIFAPIKKVSGLMKKDPLKAIKTGLLELSCGYRNSYNSRYYWEKVENFQHDDKKTYYYLPMSNYNALHSNGTQIVDFLETFWPSVNDANILDASQRSVIGVRKSYISNISDLDNWVNIMDIIEEKIRAINTADIAKYAYKQVIDREVINCYTVDLVERLDDDSLFKLFTSKLRDCLSLTSSEEKLRALRLLLDTYNITLDYEDDVENIRKDYLTLFQQYPMLEFVRGSHYGADSNEKAEMLLGYIKLVDNTRSDKND